LSIEDLQRISAVLRKSRIWNKIRKAFKRWAGDKKSAKHAALELGLKTWRYMKY